MNTQTKETANAETVTASATQTTESSITPDDGAVKLSELAMMATDTLETAQNAVGDCIEPVRRLEVEAGHAPGMAISKLTEIEGELEALFNKARRLA